MVHQFNPDMLPDSAYLPGSVRYLVPGNRGRTLDNRRTPFQVIEVRPATGQFVLEVAGFEDKGARWTEECEIVRHCQFEPGSKTASDAQVKEIEEAIRRLNVPLFIPADPAVAEKTAKVLEKSRSAAREWIHLHSRFFAGHVVLDPHSEDQRKLLAADFRAYMESHGLWEMEAEFAEGFVSNPYSGEMVKGHRIVLAEMGLAAFSDKAIRNPKIFDGAWSKGRREAHMVSRLGFVRAMFEKAGTRTLLLYRGISFEGQPEDRNKTFVSTSLDFEIARSCFGKDDAAEAGILYRQSVPVDRVFMSCLETDQMNRHFRESEVVLLADPANRVF